MRLNIKNLQRKALEPLKQKNKIKKAPIGAFYYGAKINNAMAITNARIENNTP